MRVLAIGSLYPPHHLGGYEVIWRAADRHLRALGHDVRVLASDYRSPRLDPGVEEEPDVHRELRWYWRDHEFPRLSALERLRLERGNASVLARHLREFAPDAVCWWAMGGMSLSLVEQVRRTGVPAAGVVCDDWLLYGPDVDAWTRLWRSRPRWARVAARLSGVPTTFAPGRAARWLFISEVTRRRARALFDLPDTGLAYAGVDPAAFPRAPERRWSGSLLYAGRIDPRKGVDTAIAALADLDAGSRLRVVGDGDSEHLAELRAQARAAGLGERVAFEPPVPHARLAHLYAEADAVIFPVKWHEPWGLVPLEAMAVGRPVVATGEGGSAEYLEHERNCLLFPAGDHRAAAAALKRLAGDEELRRRLREGGFETAARFTERACNEAVARTIAEVAA